MMLGLIITFVIAAYFHAFMIGIAAFVLILKFPRLFYILTFKRNYYMSSVIMFFHFLPLLYPEPFSLGCHHFFSLHD